MSQQIIIDYWVEKAGEDLASARDNLKSRKQRGQVFILDSFKSQDNRNMVRP